MFNTYVLRMCSICVCMCSAVVQVLALHLSTFSAAAALRKQVFQNSNLSVNKQSTIVHEGFCAPN